MRPKSQRQPSLDAPRTLDGDQARRLLRDLFEGGVAAAAPGPLMRGRVPISEKGRTVAVGAGKAAAAMAQAVEEEHCRLHPEPDGPPLTGLVIVPYGHSVPCRFVEVVEAGHPVPDAAGAAGTQRMIHLLSALSPDDQVIAVFSGGTSALLTSPAPGVTLECKRTLTRSLLATGASIDEVNTVRKHLSRLKGGRLALLVHPAQLTTFLVSDVPGDDPSVIASGPTVADPTTCADAIAVVDKYGLALPEKVRALLTAGHLETPKPGNARLASAETVILAGNRTALEAAREVAQACGLGAVILGDSLEGDAEQLAADQARLLVSIGRAGPLVLLSGGEASVAVHGTGNGGRNSHFALALCVAVREAAKSAVRSVPTYHALAADTDGIDGRGGHAGAFAGSDTLARAAAAGLHARSYLQECDSLGFFSHLGDVFQTGPTLTNVADFRAILLA